MATEKGQEMIYKKKFTVSDFTDVKPTENSHKDILAWANERRPYSPSDSVPQGFFPDFNKKSR